MTAIFSRHSLPVLLGAAVPAWLTWTVLGVAAIVLILVVLFGYLGKMMDRH